jgi:hypothetical protein
MEYSDDEQDDGDSRINPEHLFLEVYNQVVQTLGQYFMAFKNSPEFVQLEDDIVAEQRLYEEKL